MTPTPATLYRFNPQGRYLGFIAVDRPIAEYAHRIGVDLCTDEPPAAPPGRYARRVDDAWVLVDEGTGEEPVLAEVKEKHWGLMKGERRAAMQAPLITPHGTFDADTDSRANIVQTAQLMQTMAQSLAPGDQPTIEFTLFDNSVVTLTAAEMVEVALLLAQQIQAAFTRGRQVRAAIEAATTVEEVEAITWSPAP